MKKNTPLKSGTWLETSRSKEEGLAKIKWRRRIHEDIIESKNMKKNKTTDPKKRPRATIT